MSMVCLAGLIWRPRAAMFGIVAVMVAGHNLLDGWSWQLHVEQALDGVPGFTEGLWAAYASWAVAVVVLYPACRWFAGVKQRNKSPWLSYL